MWDAELTENPQTHRYLQSMSAMMSSASSWTDTSSCLAMALVRRPVIFLQTLAARAEPDRHTGVFTASLKTKCCPLQKYRTNSCVCVQVVFAASLPLEAGGSSPITVLSPMEEMSLSCSLSDSMLVHRVSTMVSTWYSFTLLTSGPRLWKQTHPVNGLN